HPPASSLTQTPAGRCRTPKRHQFSDYWAMSSRYEGKPTRPRAPGSVAGVFAAIDTHLVVALPARSLSDLARIGRDFGGTRAVPPDAHGREAMRNRIFAALAGVALMFATTTSAAADVTVAPGGATPGTASNFTLVGHNPLFNRGMNAALAIFKHFVYVGNRSDGSNSCGDLNGTGPVVPVLTPTNPDGTCTHVHPGILIVDVHDPADPTVVGEIPAAVAAPNAAGEPAGVPSRELRVWPQRKLVI